MLVGNPYNQKTSSTKRLAISGVLIVFLVGTNIKILVNQLAITQMASCPWFVVGSLVINFIEILFHLSLGISKGCIKSHQPWGTLLYLFGILDSVRCNWQHLYAIESSKIAYI